MLGLRDPGSRVPRCFFLGGGGGEEGDGSVPQQRVYDLKSPKDREPQVSGVSGVSGERRRRVAVAGVGGVPYVVRRGMAGPLRGKSVCFVTVGFDRHFFFLA